MQELLDEIQSIPGIVGGFVFNAQNGVLVSDLPTVFKEARLLKIGRILTKLFAKGKAGFNQLMEITLAYEETLVIVREIREGDLVILLCDPGVNLNLLTMTLNLIIEELDRPKAASPPPSDPAPTLRKASPPPPAAESPEALMNEGPMAATLAEMQAALAKVVGPMAKILFMDALEKWTRSGPVGPETLDRLLDILDDEIADPDKSADYRNRVTPVMSAQTSNMWRGGERK